MAWLPGSFSGGGEADDIGVEEDFDQVWNPVTPYHQYIYVTYMKNVVFFSAQWSILKGAIDKLVISIRFVVSDYY